MKSKIYISVFLLQTVFSLWAQNITIPVETDNVAIVMQTNAEKQLKIIYSGKRLKNFS